MDLTVLEAAEPEAGVLAGLIAAAFAGVAERFMVTRDTCPSHPAFVTADRIRHSLSRGTVYLMARQAGQPCGCIGIGIGSSATDACALERLAVLPGWRRRGIGGRLLDRAVDTARAHGCRRVEVGLIAAHAELWAWYEARGFRFTCRTSYPHLPFDVAHLRLDLSSS
ncbi:GNAT family N-acetyltransferase [Azospirillum sp. TSO22-1]|uniref:GNAT family N-acetyltransferase n=1 Tax=Azospirillum sp. TSO22-1 TaxID=716789 RepID=UPI0013049D3D|nr:GNAT family N-acetyltransferase [Azospirillum sp. TSO22-1]